MKKMILMTAIVLASCSTTPVDKNAENSHRIIGKEDNVYESVSYRIIEVDGVEYLTTGNGGICPLVKKDSLK